MTLTRVVEEAWTGEFKGAKQCAERAGMVAFDLECAPAGLAARVQGRKRVDLLGKQALLDHREELFGFGER